jgi:4-amino-4-deoxy-L-arabinose transferase-like glycosyltransferase
MPERTLGWRGLVCLTVLTATTVGVGLGSSTRLTYHEAFVAQGASEILGSGQWWYPTIGGLPWLEKPPLPFWLAAMCGWVVGTISETTARFPSALAALGLVLGVAVLTTQRYGRVIGLLAGAIQATTGWTVMRGRLAEADILLACLITWTMAAFDQMRMRSLISCSNDDRAKRDAPPRWGLCQWTFFGLLGTSALVKGTGFGTVLALSVAAMVLVWDRDRITARGLLFPAGWAVVAFLVLAWPLAMVLTHGPKVAELWVMHITQRLGTPPRHGPFAGETWPAYGFNIFGQALPWVPLTLSGAWQSLGRALRGTHSYQGLAAGDRLLWAWSVAPLTLVSVASARNAHYTIYALIPWSIWAALGLARLGARLLARGFSPMRLGGWTVGTFTVLGLIYGLGFWLLAPWLAHRGTEWGFYDAVGRQLPVHEPLVLLYDDWDRDPYPTPFGPIPHDLAVRLYYLIRPACWHFKLAQLEAHLGGRCAQGTQRESTDTVLVIGRQRDVPVLEQLGRVEFLAQGPCVRWDRTYLLARVRPGLKTASSAGGTTLERR